jgi:hypothetical protein
VAKDATARIAGGKHLKEAALCSQQRWRLLFFLVVRGHLTFGSRKALMRRL